MLNKLRHKLAQAIAPRPNKPMARSYATARSSRLTADWHAPTSSADTELASSLRALRNRSRALVRDYAYAGRACRIVVDNVIGSGINMQAAVESSRGGRLYRVNADIESAWKIWCEPQNCHMGAKLHFADIERQAMAQIFTAGEVILRKHYRPVQGSSIQIPLALEIVEAERIADDYQIPQISTTGTLRIGVETDNYQRPLAIWIRDQHPSEFATKFGNRDTVQRVPIEQLYHLYMIDRWPQTRGEPWMHAVAKRLQDLDGYSEAEIVAARAAAAYMAVIESPEAPSTADLIDSNSPEFELEPGATRHLMPGEKFTSFSPNRPNPGLEQFMRALLREVAAGACTTYESISRDYSQSNYSSSRLALIDDRDAWRAIQQWFIRSFRAPLHREWLKQAMLAGVIKSIPQTAYWIDQKKYEAAVFRPRGWSWVDPTKEVTAYKDAVRNGFMTVGDVVSLTGGGKDLEEVLDERRAELDMMKERDLTFDTSVDLPGAGDNDDIKPEMDEQTNGETRQMVIKMRAAS